MGLSGLGLVGLGYSVDLGLKILHSLGMFLDMVWLFLGLFWVGFGFIWDMLGWFGFISVGLDGM